MSTKYKRSIGQGRQMFTECHARPRARRSSCRRSVNVHRKSTLSSQHDVHESYNDKAQHQEWIYRVLWCRVADTPEEFKHFDTRFYCPRLPRIGGQPPTPMNGCRKMSKQTLGVRNELCRHQPRISGTWNEAGCEETNLFNGPRFRLCFFISQYRPHETAISGLIGLKRR